MASGAVFMVVDDANAPLPWQRWFGQKMQEAELAYLMSSEAAQTTLAENYTGLPF